MPESLVVVADDAALWRVLNDGRGADAARPVVGLRGGDLWRTLGGAPGRPAPIPGGSAALMTVDLGVLRVDGDDVLFAAHVLARRRWWRGEVVAVMNAQYVGERDLAPRSHPNDGRLDVMRVRASMSLVDRWRATRRARTGAHVPHPDIEQLQTAAVLIDLASPLDIVIDGVPLGRQARLDVRVIKDALTVAI